jgi:hypothetical protein
MIISKVRPAQDRRTVFSEERGSFRVRVASTSQDRVPWRSGLLALSTAQSLSTYIPDFYQLRRNPGEQSRTSGRILDFGPRGNDHRPLRIAHSHANNLIRSTIKECSKLLTALNSMRCALLLRHGFQASVAYRTWTLNTWTLNRTGALLPNK